MELDKAPCWQAQDEEKAEAHGDPHEAHGFWTIGWASWAQCPGWTPAQAGAVALVRAVQNAGRDDRAGLRVEAHPLVEYCLRAVLIPGYAEFVANLDDPLSGFGIPVMRCVAMERGAWRLLAGLHDSGVIAEGVIPH